ncbi:peptidyl-prolyl cis-trans isomerase-like 1 isoform X2 [Schistocerca americana]|nr:peptidyl-prolyl cis-trans isomerase-like 1 isoform X2 [Schistocerca americana]
MGEIVIELYWKHAPATCRNFAELVRRGYYNGTKFHRIIRDFMIQGGDPTGTGKGGISIYGRAFEDEIHEELKHTGAGIISMANSGPNTNGSQFFITLAPTQWLDGKHTIFVRYNSGSTIQQGIMLSLWPSWQHAQEIHHCRICIRCQLYACEASMPLLPAASASPDGYKNIGVLPAWPHLLTSYLAYISVLMLDEFCATVDSVVSAKTLYLESHYLCYCFSNLVIILHAVISM